MIFLISFIAMFFSMVDFTMLFGIGGVPGSIQFNFKEIISYIWNIITNRNLICEEKIIYDEVDNYKTVYGYCARQLFESFINSYKKNAHVIGVSPLLHTSFRNIIDKNFSPENIHIFDLDDDYNTVIKPNNDIKYDIIVITHIWGKYMNFDAIKNNTNENTIIVEDSILCGKYKYEFDKKSDLIFHSCGMDKRRSSIIGGYVYIKSIHSEIIKNMVNNIESLSFPSRNDILKKITDISLLYGLYNIKIIQNIVKLYIYLNNKNLSDVVLSVRKNKPGFEHNNYMKRPIKLMIDTNRSLINKEYAIEKLFITKNFHFLSNFTDSQLKKYFPHNYRNEHSCLPYNIIFMEEKYQDDFIEYFNSFNTCILNNPTYKSFEHANEKTKKIVNEIMYLPNVYNMSIEELSLLAIKIKNFLNKIS